MLPAVSPTAVGAKIAVKVADCPAINANGSGGPCMLNPLPDSAVCVIVRPPAPIFVTVKFFLLLEPIATFPKLRFEELVPRPAEDTHPDRIRVTNNIAKSIVRLRGLLRKMISDPGLLHWRLLDLK